MAILQLRWSTTQLSCNRFVKLLSIRLRGILNGWVEQFNAKHCSVLVDSRRNAYFKSLGLPALIDGF